MPDPPDDNEKPPFARKSKRVRRTTTPRRINSDTGTTRAELLAQCPPEARQVIEMLFSLHPKRLLAFILMAVLRDRITDEELHFICNTYYGTLTHRGIRHD